MFEILSNKTITSIVLPDGEQTKTLSTIESVCGDLLTAKTTRNSTIVALGGGVTGDIAGFAASCYQRGVDFIQVPTTLLAQVDSSVGGKTGVNHALGKNMIGAFYQPRLVCIATDTLRTLDERQFAAGIAEVVKYGLISDSEFFDWIADNLSALQALEHAQLGYAISKSCRMKAAIVAADEREAGQRALLNLGHTFGHAIESSMGYGNWLHGEAVAAGTCMAARLSLQLGWLNSGDVARIEQLFTNASLPISAPREISVEQFLSYMAVDKKNVSGKIRLILMQGIGEALITDEVPIDTLERFLDQELLRN
jgi:3-dehydroquinate synthase